MISIDLSLSFKELLKLTQNISLFSKLPESFFLDLHNVMKVVIYKKGKVLYLKETGAEFFYIIHSGQIKLHNYTLDGQEIIVEILNALGVFGYDAIFSGGKYLTSAQLLDNAKLIRAPLALLEKHLNNGNGQLSMNLLSLISKLYIQYNQYIEHFFMQSTAQRIGCFLLNLCPRHQLKYIALKWPYDKKLLALKLGMYPETFSRSLKLLQNETGIQISKAHIKIDSVEQLTKFTCKACSSIYPCQNMK